MRLLIALLTIATGTNAFASTLDCTAYVGPKKDIETKVTLEIPGAAKGELFARIDALNIDEAFGPTAYEYRPIFSNDSEYEVVGGSLHLKNDASRAPIKTLLLHYFTNAEHEGMPATLYMETSTGQVFFGNGWCSVLDSTR